MLLLIALFYSIASVHCLGTYIYLSDKLIQEEIPIGSLIADIADEISNSNIQTSQNEYLDSTESQHFTFLDDVKSSTENTYFLLDSITGRVTSKRYLDRESMCFNKHCANNCEPNGTCIMNLKILTIPSYNIASLNILIQDINDHKPQFRNEILEQTIAENVPIGYRIPLDLAYDPDIGLNSIQSYNLVTKIAPFDLEHNLNESYLSLVVKQRLDRETMSQYNLTISACDGGTPSNCGLLKLTLYLLDINDNNPLFDRSYYTFHVTENQPENTLIGQVKATDLDLGLNSKIKYSLLNNPSDYFDLNSETGELRLRKPLDYEKEQYFNLNIEAKDCGVGSLPAYALVEVNVLDLNDNPPEISVSFLNLLQRNSSEIYVHENLEANKFIAHVSISDRDSDENNRLEWKVYVNKKELTLPSVLISDQMDDSLLRINKLNANSFTINTGPRSNILFDREKLDRLNISIVANDRVNWAFYNFSLILLDLNDNYPQFEKNFYELNINENNYLDQLIHKFNAIDLDQAENGQVIYSVEGVQVVYIEPLTGYLRASRVFDRELKDSYEFFVLARDNAKEIADRKITRVKCKLNIIDLNDNRPNIFYNSSALKFKKFSNKTDLVLNLNEDLSVSSQLIKFHCDDADLGPNAETSFKLSSTSQEIIPFKITSEGKFYLDKKLDREFQDFYELTLVCQDNGAIKLNSSLNLKIEILDSNDNCPKNLYKDEKSLKSIFLNKDLKFPRQIFDEYYMDDDLGPNAELNFKLENYLQEFKLSVNKSKESKPLVYSLKFELKKNQSEFKLGKYVIKIRINDLGSPACEKEDYFIVYIGNRLNPTEAKLIQSLSNNISFINDPEPGQAFKESLKSFNFSSQKFRNERLLLIGFISILILLGSIFSFIILIYYCRKSQKRQNKKPGIEGLKVRNYSNQDEQNNLLDSELNRLSLSIKSSDQSVCSDPNDFYQKQKELNTISSRVLGKEACLSSFGQIRPNSKSRNYNSSFASTQSTSLTYSASDSDDIIAQSSLDGSASSAASDISDMSYMNRNKTNYNEEENEQSVCLYAENRSYFNVNQLNSTALNRAYLRSSAV